MAAVDGVPSIEVIVLRATIRRCTSIVIGAGVFGTWTARWLRRRGASVTLVDQYGAGNSLSSSGDESRVTRSSHGSDDHYPGWQRRSLEQWLQLDPRLFVRTGVLWLARSDDGFEARSAEALERHAIPIERLTTDAMAERWPQLATAGLAWGLLEPEGGVLLARRAVDAAARAFVEEGGVVRIGLASVDGTDVHIGDERLEADAFVFAAGPWLPKLLGPLPALELSVPQQEVIYFATPPGDTRFDAANLPTWVEYDAAFYGLPSIEGRGFKVAPDWPGPLVDPDRHERRISDERVEASRSLPARIASRRWPASPWPRVACASTSSRPTRTSSSTATRRCRRPGSSEAGPGTASSMARRSASTSRRS